MSSQNSFGVKGIIMLLILLIGIPIGLYGANQTSINYQVNGTKVTATVINVESWKIGKKHRETVTVTYVNEDGQPITAKAINAGDVFENDTITGKVVPEKPEEVFLEPPMWQHIVVYGVSGLLYFFCLLILFGLVRGRKTDKQIAAQGKITDADIIRREFIGDETFVDIEFRDENGNLRFGSCRAPIYLKSNASTCTIRYLVKSEKKIICEIV